MRINKQMIRPQPTRARHFRRRISAGTLPRKEGYLSLEICAGRTVPCWRLSTRSDRHRNWL